jgi:hypothetical protein
MEEFLGNRIITFFLVGADDAVDQSLRHAVLYGRARGRGHKELVLNVHKILRPFDQLVVRL